MNTSLWRTGPEAAGRATTDVVVSCDRRLRGPYAGAGSMLRVLVPTAAHRRPDLVNRHAVEILAAAPDVARFLGAAGRGHETLTSSADPEEQTRLHPAARTRRLAHGLVDFVIAYATLIHPAVLALTFTEVDAADPTDQEFLAILVRRAHGAGVSITLGTCGAGSPLPDALESALSRYANPAPAPVRTAAAHVASTHERSADELVRAYIESDGTSDDDAELTAYQNADLATRAALHDARADLLTRDGDWGLRLGAIPYHREHGTDRAAATEAFLTAAYHCRRHGYYDALHDFASRGAAVVDPATEPEPGWLLPAMAATALTALRRVPEAEAAYEEIRARFTLPRPQIFAAYGMSMAYARYRAAHQRDQRLAKAQINIAITIASLLPDPAERAFQTVFNQNGLAFVELRLGALKEAHRLVTQGLARLDRELPPGRHRLHRSVLVHNRARVNVALGRFPDALADYAELLGLDPNYADYWVDRANLRDRLGDTAGALADYDTAIGLTPPYWELHHDRAGMRHRVGDTDGAVADLTRVMELEPDQLDSRVDLVDLLLEAARLDEAGAHVQEGLLLHPGDARLLYRRGTLTLASGGADADAAAAALADFDGALESDPAYVPALAARAGLAFDRGDQEAALSDLTRAVEAAPDDPDLLYNRGYVRQAAGRWSDAIDDYTRALALPGADEAELLQRRAECDRATAEGSGRDLADALGRGAPAGAA